MANRTYRYFKGKPLYHFGDGLSYTSFAYSNIRISNKKPHAGDPLTVEADVKNTGPVEGDEVTELYLAPPRTAVSPNLELAGFERLHLSAGESRHITFHLDQRILSQVDEAGVRAVGPGSYRVYMGGSQPGGDAAEGVQAADFIVDGRQQLPH